LQSLTHLLSLRGKVSTQEVFVGTPAQKKAILALLEHPAQVDEKQLTTAFTLSGIVTGKQGRRAMINGASFGIGDPLAGFASIVEISANAVTIQWGARQLKLEM
jgi:hypothetical protein